MVWLNDAKREKQRLAEVEARRKREIEERYRRKIEVYNALDPMVRRLLDDLGQATWGEGYSIDSDPNSYSWVVRKTISKLYPFIMETREHYSIQLDFPDETNMYFCLDASTIRTKDVKEESLESVLSKAFIKGPDRLKWAPSPDVTPRGS